MTETVPALRMERHLSADVASVWMAWTDPVRLAQWISPNPDLAVRAECDLRVGGRWVVMMGPYGVRGEYLQIQGPRLLQFSWSFDHEPDLAPSLVTVELTETSTGTTLVLTHTNFADAEDRGGNAEGWTLCLQRLESLLG